MKKIVILLTLALMVFGCNVASANLADNRASIAAKYGEYRMVVDTDGQLWTKAEWEAGGDKKAKAGAYVYYFNTNGINVQMEVLYESSSPDAVVKSQRFTPDVSIKVKDFKNYFPDAYSLVASSKAKAFGTYGELTRNFRDDHSPVTLGVVIRETPVKGKGNFYTIMAFNVKDEGRLIKDVKFINNEIYVHEFTIERISRYQADGGFETGNDWEYIKNPFLL